MLAREEYFSSGASISNAAPLDDQPWMSARLGSQTPQNPKFLTDCAPDQAEPMSELSTPLIALDGQIGVILNALDAGLGV